jgi:hypothetical protein
MSQVGLEQFGAYQKARQLFDLVAADMEKLKTNPLCYRLVSQQIAARIRSVQISKRVTEDSAAQSTFGFSISRVVLLVRRVGGTGD